MRLTLIALALAATAVFAAGEQVVTPVPAKQMQPGYGVVESVTPVRVQRERSAAAGGSAGSAERGRPMYRVAVRLPDGSLQYRDLDRPEFKVGDNVLLTNAGDILPD
jgi:hypothetical protein